MLAAPIQDPQDMPRNPCHNAKHATSPTNAFHMCFPKTTIL